MVRQFGIVSGFSKIPSIILDSFLFEAYLTCNA